MHEQVEIDIGPEHLARLDTIIDPVVVSELPTVLWSPHGHEEAVNSLPAHGRRDAPRHRRSARFDRNRCARARSCSRRPTSSTWRGCAPRRGASGWRRASTPRAGVPRWSRSAASTVRHREGSTRRGPAARRLAGLAPGLGGAPAARAIRRGAACRARATSTATRCRSRSRPVDQDARGLAGVTVAWDGGLLAVAGSREGGLCARESIERRGARVEGAGRLARARAESSAKECGRRCCAIPPTAPRSR